MCVRVYLSSCVFFLEGHKQGLICFLCVGAGVCLSLTFTSMHLADTFIQSDLQCIQAINFFLSVFLFLCIFLEDSEE